MTNPIPAATLVLFRQTGAAPEHLFVERAGTMAFAAGAIVFPGGRVDPGDHRLAAACPGHDAEDAAARIAAIRETIEEAGVAIGLVPQPDAETVARLRAQLVEGLVFADILAAAGCGLDLDALVPFARWCPNLNETRTFDTRFYIARAGDSEGGGGTVDATENTRLFWASARHALDEADAGRVKIIYPTRRNLERLAMFDSFEGAAAHVAETAPVTITPWIESRGDARFLCIPQDCGYPVSAEPLETAMRG